MLPEFDVFVPKRVDISVLASETLLEIVPVDGIGKSDHGILGIEHIQQGRLEKIALGMYRRFGKHFFHLFRPGIGLNWIGFWSKLYRFTALKVPFYGGFVGFSGATN